MSDTAIQHVLDALADEQHANLCNCAAYPAGCVSNAGYTRDYLHATLTYAEDALAKALQQGWEPPAAPPVSSQDTPPAPRRQWAVQHPDVEPTPHHSEHTVLYTLSKLPGGVIVTRDAPDQPWRTEAACLCVTVPDSGHYAGCPAPRPAREWRKGDPEPSHALTLQDATGDRIAYAARGWAWCRIESEDYGITPFTPGVDWINVDWDDVAGGVLTEVPSPSTQTGGHP